MYLIRLNVEGVATPPELQAHVEKVAAGMARGTKIWFSSLLLYLIVFSLQHLARPNKIRVFITSGFTSKYIYGGAFLTRAI